MPDNTRVHIVLLSGGSGSRLWPLSNATRSKQFLKVLRDPHGEPESMVQRTFRMLRQIYPTANIIVTTTVSQEQSLCTQIDGTYNIVLEPKRRDTAPAVMLACIYLESECKVESDDTVIVLPIDAYAGSGYYQKLAVLDKAVQKDVAELLLMGVRPTFPSEKYGYIVPETIQENVPWLPVARFVEKPSFELANKLISHGALWNCGVFAFRLCWALDLLAQYGNFFNYDDLVKEYDELPKNSFDYEVVERADSVAVVPYDEEWKDLGTWNTLSEKMADPTSGHVYVDWENCSNLHVINETNLPLAVAGISDAVVIATPDGILACGKPESAHIKELVAEASASRPMYEQRRWGEYRVLDSTTYPNGASSLTKELIIKAGCQLSYQRHTHRSEVWTIVFGQGEVVLDGEEQTIAPGAVIDIPAGYMHAVRAFDELHIIEVQLGDPLIEEDIERFGNWWDA